MANTLFLILQGPLQSWGERARWSVRDWASETNQVRYCWSVGVCTWVESDEKLRSLSHSVHVGVRCDRKGSVLVDYHTVGGGYEKPMMLTAAGKLENQQWKAAYLNKPGAPILPDASFVAASPRLINSSFNYQSGTEQLGTRSGHFYLGRNMLPIPPGLFLVEQVNYASLEEALQAYPLYLRGK